MVSSRNFVRLALVVLAVSFASLDARSLQELEQQSEANVLGTQMWCNVCRSLGDFNAAELLLLSSRTLTLGESLLLSCQTLTGATQERCERVISTISEGVGYSLATTGNVFPATCDINPFCRTANDVPAIPSNTIFDYLCRQCKAIAGIYFGSVDVVVTEENIRAVFAPFCAAIGILGASQRCLDNVARRFHEIYTTGTAALNPETVCALYGACAFRTMPPAPAVVPMAAPKKQV